MKRLIYCLLALPMLFMASSCSNDDDLPEVSFKISFSGMTYVDGTFYVVQGTDFSIDGITVTPADGTKEAAIGAVTYGWDYMDVGTVIEPPFGSTFTTEALEPGNHVLQMEASILQVDKALAIGYFTYPVKIVASADDIPAGSEVSPAVIDANPDIRSGSGAKFK